MSIRVATPADIPAMKDIRDTVRENSLVTMRVEPADYENAMAGGRAWVALEGDEVVGFSCARLREGDIWALFMRESFERRGHGNALMAEAERFLFENGIGTLVLTTAAGTKAERLYLRRGWIVAPEHTTSGELLLRLRR